MKRLLIRGQRQVKNKKPPSEGFLLSLFTKKLKNGWYYQIDWIRDSRFFIGPVVKVYAFKPPFSMECRSADYYLD